MSNPERFGPYLLLKKIGRGGMAELFLARQVGVAGFERVLAIKRILPHLTEDRDFVQMFINEAKLAAQITHPNVVQIYDFGTIQGTYYMAMEYVMGKSLAAILTQAKELSKPVPVAQALHIAARIASGLDHAYRGVTVDGTPLGIIHRDISPQNILVAYHGDVKLVDFGIAKAASSGTHTQTGMLKGKLAYLSPEQAWGKPVDHRSDLFALGIVLHEMLTEQRLFKSENEFTTLERVRTADVQPPSAVKADLPADLDALVLKALAKLPDDRYATGRQFEDALDGYLRRTNPGASGRDLTEYLRGLFEKDIRRDTIEYQQVTAVTKAPVAPPKQPAAAHDTTSAARPAPSTKPAAVRPAKAPTNGVGLLLGAALVAVLGLGAWYLVSTRTLPAPAVSNPPPPIVQAPIVETPVAPAAPMEPKEARPLAVSAPADDPPVVEPPPPSAPRPKPSPVRKRSERSVAAAPKPSAPLAPSRRPASAMVSKPPVEARPMAQAAPPAAPRAAAPPPISRPAAVSPPVRTVTPPAPQPAPSAPAPSHDDAPLPFLP